MAVTSKEEWKCDFCGKTETVSCPNRPAYWVKCDVEDRYLDRSWHTKVLCNSCARAVSRAHKKQLETPPINPAASTAAQPEG